MESVIFTDGYESAVFDGKDFFHLGNETIEDGLKECVGGYFIDKFGFSSKISDPMTLNEFVCILDSFGFKSDKIKPDYNSLNQPDLDEAFPDLDDIDGIDVIDADNPMTEIIY